MADIATELESKLDMPFGTSLTKDRVIAWFAQERLNLFNAYDPRDRMAAMFNPETLELGATATIGKLNVIGSSHSVQQYSHSEVDDFQVVMVYDHLAMLIRNGSQTEYDINKPADWLTSFVFPRGEGVAPPLLVLSWKSTLGMLVAVKSAKTAFKQWFADGQPKACVVTMSVCEIRRAERTPSSHRLHGWRQPEAGVPIGGSPASDYPLGAPRSRMLFGKRM